MTGHIETQPSSREERIRQLEEELQNTRNELSYMGTTLIDEKNERFKVREYADTVMQENERLKKRVEELEAEARRSGARTQEYSHNQEQRRPRQMSPVSVPTSPRVPHPQRPEHHHQYRCSPAMATCDGMYFEHLRETSSPPRISPETPDHDHDERIITRDGKRYRLYTQYGINGYCWTCEDEIPDNQDQSQPGDEYETDPATYWQKAYPEWEDKYRKQ
jgi:hypothetical protein